MKKLFGYLIHIIFSFSVSYSQQIVSPAGGEATGPGGTMSYTIGQVVYTAIAESAGTIAQGVQQPFEIFIIDDDVNKYENNLEFSIYPNPVFGYIKLKLTSCRFDNLTFQLYNSNGNLLENRRIVGAETTIQMDLLSPSVYFLIVTDHCKEVKTFKIVKK